jgi:uncharacterized membrane protein
MVITMLGHLHIGGQSRLQVQADKFFMARVGIIFGLLLCALTVVALLYTTAKMPSLFVPMMIGIPILFCSIVGLNPHRRKNAMLNAVAVGTLGLIVGSALAIHAGMSLAGMSLTERVEIQHHVIRVGLSLAGLSLLFILSYAISLFQGRSPAQ